MVASLTGAGTASANMVDSIHEKSNSLESPISQASTESIEKTLRVGDVNQYSIGGEIFGFVLEKSEDGVLVAGHYSHSSHESHGSHRSHYSG